MGIPRYKNFMVFTYDFFGYPKLKTYSTIIVSEFAYRKYAHVHVLLYQCHGHLHVEAYLNSNYVSNHKERRKNLVTWQSHKKHVLSLWKIQVPSYNSCLPKDAMGPFATL